MTIGKRRGHDVSCPYTEKSRSLDYARDDDEREARTLRPAPPVSLLLRLLLAPGAGGTTVGGIATRCVRRLYRSCETERDHCYQQNCSNDLHGFSPCAPVKTGEV